MDKQPDSPEAPMQPQTPQVVYVSRAATPPEPQITPEIKAKHEESVRTFPDLNLSEAEYVISAVRRHPIGLIIPVAVTTFLVLVFSWIIITYPTWIATLGLVNPPSFDSILLTGGLFIALVLLGGYASVWVYLSNKFYLTNESVIQEIQTSLFARHEQTVSLINIEDASFVQRNILQNLFDYGSIRLSTEGDETTYRFHYVSHPKEEIAILNNAVEAFKNGRPVIND